MRISELIRELKQQQREHGDVVVHARDREGDLQPVTATDVMIGFTGNREWEKLWIMAAHPETEN